MAKGKFHINGNGDVKPCNASVRACRFSDAEHFDNRQEALISAEKRLSEQYSQVSSTTLKKNSDFKKRIDEVLEQNKSVSPESLIRIGEIFDNELQNRLEFDIYGDLSNDDLQKIEKETHKLMSEIMDIGAPLKNDVYGSMSNKLNEAVSVLPNSVKDSLKNTKILAKSIRKDAMDRDGQHMGNARFRVDMKSKGRKVSEFEKEDTRNLPDGAVYIKGCVLNSEITDPSSETRAMVKREGSDIYDEVWIGGKGKEKHIGKKLSNTTEIYVNGRLMNLDKPMYEVKDSYTFTGSVISAKKTDF